METEFLNLSLVGCMNSGKEITPGNMDHEIQSFDYEIRKEISPSGEIAAPPKTGIVKVVMNSFPSERLVRWAFNARELLGGMIYVRKNKHTLPHEYLSFNKARCTGLALHYKSGRTDEMQLTIHIHAGIVSVYGEEITNYQ